MIKISRYISIFVVSMQLSSILATHNVKSKQDVLEACDSYSSLSYKTAQLSFTKCTMQDSACLINKGRALLGNFINGIPELGIEKLDKLFIDTIEINTDNINHELKNVEVEGFKNATINDLSFDEVFKIIRLSFETTLETTCEYTVDGILFMQPISGSGPTSYTAKNLQTDMIFFYDIVKKENGKHMLEIKGYRYGMFMKDGAKYRYKNLFNGDKEKNDAVCAFLDKNWTIVTNVFGNKFYGRIYDKIFEAIKKYVESRNLEDMVLF